MKELKALLVSGEGNRFRVWGPKTADEAMGLPADSVVLMVEHLDDVNKLSIEYLAFTENLNWRHGKEAEKHIYAIGELLELATKKDG